MCGACGGESGGSEPAAGAASHKNKTYKSVEALRDAFVDAGHECPAWDQDDRIEAALESGNCSDSVVLSIYVNREEAVAAAEALTSIGADMLGEDTRVLVGPNWIINANDEDYATLKSELGGTIETAYATS